MNVGAVIKSLLKSHPSRYLLALVSTYTGTQEMRDPPRVST